MSCESSTDAPARRPRGPCDWRTSPTPSPDPGTGVDTAGLERTLYHTGLNQSLHNVNLGPWFEARLPLAVRALEELVGWVASGTLRVPVSRTLPLGGAAEAHRLLESGATTGKLILKP